MKGYRCNRCGLIGAFRDNEKFVDIEGRGWALGPMGHVHLDCLDIIGRVHEEDPVWAELNQGMTTELLDAEIQGGGDQP